MGVEKLIGTLRDAEVWKDENDAVLDQLENGCRDYILRRRANSNPKIMVPSAKDSNEGVCIKLGIFGDGREQFRGKAFEQWRVERSIPHLLDIINKSMSMSTDLVLTNWYSLEIQAHLVSLITILDHCKMWN